jgi:hypothetical protein
MDSRKRRGSCETSLLNSTVWCGIIRRTIRLDTLRALREHDHQLAAYCSRCQRWAVLDLERLIAEGRGEQSIFGITA